MNAQHTRGYHNIPRRSATADDVSTPEEYGTHMEIPAVVTGQTTDAKQLEPHKSEHKCP